MVTQAYLFNLGSPYAVAILTFAAETEIESSSINLNLFRACSRTANSFFSFACLLHPFPLGKKPCSVRIERVGEADKIPFLRLGVAELKVLNIMPARHIERTEGSQRMESQLRPTPLGTV